MDEQKVRKQMGALKEEIDLLHRQSREIAQAMARIITIWMKLEVSLSKENEKVH